MSRFVCGLILGSALAPGLAFQPKDEDKELKAARKDVLDIAGQIEAGKKVDTAAIRKKYDDLDLIMNVYKPRIRSSGGKPGSIDGVEAKIMHMAKRELLPTALRKEKYELIKMAYVNIAVAEIAQHYAPKTGKGPRLWRQYNGDVIRASKEFIKAVNAEDAAKLKTAATNINSACNNCHKDYRD